LDIDSKWNPSILNVFSKQLVLRCQKDGMDETRNRFLLSVIKANRRGIWSPDLSKGLSLLLENNTPEAMDILASVIEKPRSTSDPDVWVVYNKYFLNALSPMKGLPYILSIWMKLRPVKSLHQLERVITRLVDLCSKFPQLINLNEYTKELFTSYLKMYTSDLSIRLTEFEQPLLDLLRRYNNPEWDFYIDTISKQLQDNTIVKISESESQPVDERIEKVLIAPDNQQIMNKPLSVSSPISDLKQLPSLKNIQPVENGYLKRLEQSRSSFLKDINAITQEYINMKNQCEQITRQLQNREEKLFKLEESQSKLKNLISNHQATIKEAYKKSAELQSQIEHLMNDRLESEKRSDERVHQIQMQAENEVNRFKHELWKRLRPDLDDLIQGNLNENDYATAERGRSLFRRIQDIIKSLRFYEIIA